MSRITDAVAQVVADVIERAAPGQSVDYDVALALMPGPDGGPKPILAIVLAIPSPILGQGLANTLIVNNLTPDPQAVEDAVRNAIEGLQKQRTAMLASSNGHGTPGELTTPGRLILPGQ